MQTKLSRTPDMRKRLLILCVVIAFVILPYLLWKLVDIQLVNYKEYQERAIRQQTRPVTITPARGTIYDANMTPLAVSAAVETIVMAPANLQEDKIELVCSQLASLLNVSYDKLKESAAKRNSFYQVVKKKVEKTEADKVRAFISENKITGIDFIEDSKRYYPYGNFAASVIGFCNADNEGQYGIESVYNDVLTGVPGKIVTARNAEGAAMPFQYEQYYDAKDGTGVVLTIDQTVQSILEKHLETALIDNGVKSKVVGIVMNIKTGEVVAMSTKPDYDLNNPRVIADEETRKAIEALPESERQQATLNALYSQWRNKAVSDPYEPGSTFKIVTASIAVEEKVVNDTETFYCPGYKMVGGWRISCWKTQGHGTLTFKGGIQNSCNPVFMELGIRIGSARYKSYFENFGLKDKTGIDLPGEATGIFFNKETLQDVDLAVLAFGQRIKVTPIQLITAVSGIANGGKMMQPHLVKAYADSNGNIFDTVEPVVVRQIVSKETSAKICGLLESVVDITQGGTGKNAYVPGYRIGGKTGTSEKLDSGDGTGRIASFVGIAPCDDPQYAVLVQLDEPTGFLKQGGQIAAPVVGKIMADILPYLGVKPVYTEEELAKLDVTVPSLIEQKVSEATSYLKNKLHLRVRIVGDGDTVTDQIPLSGVKIPQNSEVVLYCGVKKVEEKVSVPSVVDYSYLNALDKLASSGLYIQASGVIQSSVSGGTVAAVRQTPEAGTEVTKGTVVSVEFIDKSNTGE